MYSEQIIFRNLEEFSARCGWTPVYHTYDEVKSFSAYIDSLIKMESVSYTHLTLPTIYSV